MRQAITRIAELQDEGHTWIFETDIKDFYQKINRELLLDNLKSCLPDDTLGNLFANAVHCEIDRAVDLGGYAGLWSHEAGVPQGSVLSPLLANFYLYEFDEAICVKGFEMVRYVDDLVIMAKTKAECEDAHGLVLELVANLGLEIHTMDEADAKGRIKTRIRGESDPFDFLGVKICKASLQPSDLKWEMLKDKLIDATDIKHISRRNLTDLVQLVNVICEGWLSSFSFCNISPADIDSRIGSLVHSRIGVWMKRAGLRPSGKPIPPRAARHLGLVDLRGIEISPIRQQRGKVGRGRTEVSRSGHRPT